MQKNWYVVYTKPQYEKKITSLFNKWKIENFCPLTSVKESVSWRGKVVFEPLFKSYVFVYISEDQMCKVSKAEGVVNFLYWLGKPAVINYKEIQIIKEFTNEYKEIKVQSTQIDKEDPIQIIDEPSYKLEGKFISIKSKTVRAKLPSLGYTLIAEIEKESLLERQKSLLDNISPKISHQHFNTA
ncbi:MAG: UpxY family transcription antiterminator [Ginsengibacter sp.]